MPYQPLGPILRRALTAQAGPDPFDQNAVLRLLQNAPNLLAPSVRLTLTRAAKADAEAPGLIPDHDKD